MKNFKKILAAMLALIMLFAVAGCNRTPSWSYKTGDTTYAEGVYIYSLFSAYNQAYSILQGNLGDKFDATASILDIESTFDETNEKKLCKDWIISEADYITKNLAALDAKIAEYGITLDKAQVESAREIAKEDWYLGPYYEYYVSSGYEAMPYKDTFEKYGVSFDSFFTSTYLASVKQNAIFEYLYGKDGVNAVKDDELKKYFTDNYTSYAYFIVNLYETDIDATTNQQKYYPYADELVKERETELASYVKLVTSGTPYEAVVSKYMKAHDITTDPTVKNIENIEYSSLGEEVLEELNKLGSGKASYIRVGDGDTSVLYFITKFDINKEADDYIKDDNNRSNLLQSLKGEEFLDFLDEATETVEVEKNTSSTDKYDPVMFEDIL